MGKTWFPPSGRGPYPPPMATLMAIDLGGKRTGLALGDTGSGICTPLAVIHTAAAAERLRQVAKAVEREMPDTLLVGIPLNMDGSEGPAAKAARAAAAEIKALTKKRVWLVDERETSDLADELMAQSGLTHAQKKARRDALAAMVLVRRYLQDGAVGEV